MQEPNYLNRSLSAFLKLPILWLLTIGVLLRYCLGVYTSWSQDVGAWYRLGVSGLNGLGIYDMMGSTYPPIWGTIVIGVVKISSLFVDPRGFIMTVPEISTSSLQTGLLNNVITSPTFNFIIKTPLILSDVLVGYILYKFVFEMTNDERRSRNAFLLWFFNPLVIFVSSIHGTFDSFVALFLLLSVIFVYKKSYVWAGAVLMLGVLTKLSPFYLIPLLVGVIVSDSYNNSSPKMRTIFRNVVFFSAGSVIVFIITTLPLILQNSLDIIFLAVSKRAETGVVVGGVSPWFIRYIPEYSWVFGWAYDNPTIVMKLSTITALFFLCGLGITSFLLGYKNVLKTLLYGSLTTIAIVYLTAPLVNGQYLIWIFPFIILVSVLFESRYRHLLAAISLSGLLFYFSLAGIWHLLLPVAVYTNLIDLDSIILATKIFWEEKGYINVYLRDDLKLFNGLLGVTGIVLCLFPKKISYSYVFKESVAEGKLIFTNIIRNLKI